MALDAVRDTLEGLDTATADLYVEREGIYVLDVTSANGWGLENTAGLKSALEKERGNSRKLKTFEGIDPEAARASAVRIRELEEAISKQGGGKPSSALEAATAKIAGLETKLQEERDRSTSFQTSTEGAEKARQIATGMVKHGGIPEVLEPILDSRTKVEWVDGRPVVKVRGDNGGYRMSQRAGVTADMDVDEYVESLRALPAFSGCFTAPAGGGSGARTSSGAGGASLHNPFAKNTWNLTEQMRLKMQDPAKATRLSAEAVAAG